MRRTVCSLLLAVLAAACAPDGPSTAGPTTPGSEEASPAAATASTTTTPTSSRTEPTIEPIRYGTEHPSQYGHLHVPDESGSTLVILIHGGFWYAQYGLESVQPLAQDLADRGYPVWNIEYRRVGDGGGWPATFEDVAAAIDHVPQLMVEHEQVVTIGHSAGGHLALWAAARARLPGDRVGADPAVLPHAVVGLAAVSDLRAAARDGLGADAVSKLLGGAPSEVPERVRVAAPLASLPLGVPQLLVHARQDQLVPVEMSEQYAQQARAAGDDVTLELVDGGHFDVLDPRSPAWQTVLDYLER